MAAYKATLKGGTIGNFTTIATSSPMETKEENALWSYNSARQHDGLKPLKKLPKNFKFEKICDTCYDKGFLSTRIGNKLIHTPCHSCQ